MGTLMGIATKQLEAIFKEINERFIKNRYVSIKPGDGDPPERYEVTYNIAGLHQNKNKEIQDARLHSIAISIPFGFPHFPPNCKPISPIFHPDFDQAAICIGDFWNKDSSISDLIIHIGHMISGEVFSTDNAFNEEAVIWYRQHRDRLPFEILDFSMLSSPPAVPASPLDSFAELETLEIDTIEASDFESDFDLLNLEKQVKPQERSPQASEIDIDLLQLMIKQKRFYTLYKQLQTIPPDKQFNNFDELRDKALLELGKAKQLLQQGLDCEHQGQPREALEKFDLLTITVSDYPEIEENINRAKRALDILEDFPERTARQPEPASKPENVVIAEDIPKKRTVTFFTEKPKTHIPVLPLVIAGVSVVFLGIVILVFFSFNSEYKLAEKSFSDCTTLLKNDNFKGAEQRCNEALAIVKGIQFLKKQERIALAENIQKTLNSQKLRQGLAGMVLINGQYVAKSTEEALIAFKKASEEGDTFLANLAWKEAGERYNQALNIATKISTIEKAATENVRKNLTLAQVNLSIEDGKQLKQSGDFEKAIITLEKALERAKSLDEAVMTSTTKSIEPLLSITRFLASKKAGDIYFAASEWQKAADQYQKSIDNLKNIQNPPTAEVTTLHENMTKAELYSKIQSGKEAFDNAQWDEAIHRYESAIKLLKENSDILSQVTSDENRQKLSRIMLQASIIRDKQDVARKLKEGKNLLAADKLQSIINTIAKSPFNREEEFQQIAKDAHSSIVEAKNNQLISESVAYLVNNYKEIFAKNYSAAASESLSEPKATFVKKLGERLLFKLECNEKGERKPLRLVMNYIYDPATKQWQFYSEKN
jgi:ubiquitin-protein ligase